jgi:PAS domain S-box-containing protein
MDTDFSRLIEDVRVDLLGDAWHRADVGAVVFNDGRRYLAANPAYCALTGYSSEELVNLRAGHNLLLEELGEAEFIHGLTQRRTVGHTVIRRKDGEEIAVSYMVILSERQQIPCYIGLVWEQERGNA